MEWRTPRFRRRFESFAKKPSTALSQELEVGTKWKVKRRWRPSQAPHLGMLVGGVVVEDHMDALADWDLGLDGVEEADEHLVAVALHVQRPMTLPSSVSRAANGMVVPWRL